MDAVSSHAFIASPSALYYAWVRLVAIAARDVCSYNSARPSRHNIQLQFQQKEDAVQKTASSKSLMTLGLTTKIAGTNMTKFWCNNHKLITAV